MHLLIKMLCLVLVGVLLAGFAQPADVELSLKTITSVDWNPTGEHIVTGHRGLIAFWDAVSGEQVRTIEVMNPYLPTEPLTVAAAAWSPDGSRLAVGAKPMDPLGMILMLDAETGEVLATLDNQNGAPDVDWSPDGTRLATAAPELFGLPGEDAVIVWDTETYTEAGRINGELLEGISTLDWHPTENQVVTGGGLDNKAYIWDVGTGELLTTLSGYQDVVNAVAWSPDGSIIATGSQDGMLALWTGSTGQLLNSYNLSEDTVRAIDWHPDGDKLAFVGVEQGYIIDMTTGEAIASFEGAEAISWNPDGSVVATLWNNGADDDSVMIYNTDGSLVNAVVPGDAALPAVTPISP